MLTTDLRLLPSADECPDCDDTPVNYDVLIVGAGPVGLSLAIGLQSRGVENFLVIDQTRGFRPAGQVVDLLPNGLKALGAISEATLVALLAAGQKDSPTAPKGAWTRKNLQGETIRSVSLDFEDWVRRYGAGRLSLPWFELQTILRQQVAPEKICVNCRFLDCQPSPTGVLCQIQANGAAVLNPFAHWEPNQTQTEQSSSFPTPVQIKAKLVVGADGIHSAVRRAIYRGTPLELWAQPQYSGWTGFGCLRALLVADATAQTLRAEYFQGQRVVSLQNDRLPLTYPLGASPRLVMIDQGETRFGFLLQTPLAQESCANAGIETAVQILTSAGFPAGVIELAQKADPERFFVRPYYQHLASADLPSPLWSRGRVVLAGDAAHGMPPFIAQGANQGLQDSAVLAPALAHLIRQGNLDNLDALQALFTDYETRRRPRIEQVQEATLASDDWSQASWEAFCDQLYKG
ncbi:MAG: FAD-dependent oxidoreductase [Cyanobacteriota bacterium]|jgi:2-polyprenyl-6-methoxyphenol hydroxylase-like FAD-dependent oxidoreductase